MGVRRFNGPPTGGDDVNAATAIAQRAVEIAAETASEVGAEAGSIIVLVHLSDNTAAALAGNFESAPPPDADVTNVPGLLHIITEHVKAIQAEAGVDIITVMPRPTKGQG